MSLHGSILINGHPIASWSARRLDVLDDEDAYYTYEWEYVEFYSQFPGVQKERRTGQIEHRYSDGAAALAGAILQKVAGMRNS